MSIFYVKAYAEGGKAYSEGYKRSRENGLSTSQADRNGRRNREREQNNAYWERRRANQQTNSR